MKKTYIIPSTICVAIHTDKFIAASLNSLSKDGGEVETIDTELDSGIVSDSRRGSLWDDDEY